MKPAGEDVVTEALTESADGRLGPVVAAALGRAVLLTRAAVTTIITAAGLAFAEDRSRIVALLVLVVVASAAQVLALGRWPGLAAHGVAALAVDTAVLLGVLALSRGGLPYFGYAAGAAALAGVLLGAAAVPVWLAQCAQGAVVCLTVLRDTRPPPALATLLVAAPVAQLLAGIAALAVSRALVRQMRANLHRVALAQRDAAALERARLARELHDSVAKTLRSMSLAAVALPGSVRRQPALAEQLAGAISAGAAAADLQARELLEGLRLESPDEPLEATLDRLCARFSARTGIDADAEVAVGELPIAVRYELIRIAYEALTNVERHAGATRVFVALTATRRGRAAGLTVRDNGRGFAVPGDLLALQSLGHHGIVGMAERARAVGGRLEVTSRPGRGTVVHVQVPL
ncbi:sensor histidine kinase [Dactylosporangium sp. CA-092794]|uniref:sensor histidine kinase n=1 Tax=Dactylosporangium sp. CA-092794 TaxID=3239929 RepID=UPI003D93B155